MARADLIINLVRAGNESDPVLLRRTVEALAAEERAKQHHVLADRLLEQLRTNGRTADVSSVALGDQSRFLVSEKIPRITLRDLVLAELTLTTVNELVEEHLRSELLQTYGVEPRHRVLLVGPPGNGKTSLAEALAEALMVPLLVVRYDAVIGSFLGETANRLRSLFDYAKSRRCVLFFDEFDVLGKERGDVHDTGEVKRVVSSLLLQVDDLPSHTVIVTATNHPELLDRAVWRRFQVRLDLPPPSCEQIESLLTRFEQTSGLEMPMAKSSLSRSLDGSSFSEVHDFAEDIYRRYLLRMPDADLKNIVRTRLEQSLNRTAVKELRGSQRIE